MSALDQMTQHAPLILSARKALGLSSDHHPLEFYLAICEVESQGRTDLEDRDSYIGPFQIGDAYLADSRAYAAKHYPEVTLPTSREALRSDVYTSTLVVMLHMEQWQARHGWNLERMAALHKGGVGTAKQITRKVNAGMSVERAIHWASTAFRYSAGHKRAGQLIVPRTYLYVYGTDPHNSKTRERRFIQCLRDYTLWVEAHFGDGCAPENAPEVCPTCQRPLT